MTVALLAALALALPAAAPTPKLHVLTLGGGPTPEANQVAIESNVRYVSSLLPPGAQHTILFADGEREKPVVQFEAQPDSMSVGDRLVRGIIGDGPAHGRHSPWLQYRPTALPRIDGPLRKGAVGGAFSKLAQESHRIPLLLYGTGHGSPDTTDLDNNYMDMWGSGRLHVRDLSAELQKLSARRPVTIVMVQCHSGAFANLVLDEGLKDRPLCGFFAAPKDRVAAGCTPSLLEEDYKDFTGYFFAALTGRDRLGRAVPKADYNRDGKVGGDEALAYAQMNSDSIDVPTCTSDIYLRKVVPMEDDREFADLPFSRIYKLASPLRKRVLDALSGSLGPALQREDRLKIALNEVSTRREHAPNGMGEMARFSEEGSRAFEAGRRLLMDRFPGLCSRSASQWKAAYAEAVGYVNDNPSVHPALESALDARVTAEKRALEDDVRGARQLRLLRVAKSAYLEDKLRKSGDRALIARLDRLKRLEAANPLQL